MRELTIGIVAEGPSDYAVIDELIKKFIPGDHTILLLQPEESATPGFGAKGGGWVGVRKVLSNDPKRLGRSSIFYISHNSKN